jgi:hypothetical protein
VFLLIKRRLNNVLASHGQPRARAHCSMTVPLAERRQRTSSHPTGSRAPAPPSTSPGLPRPERRTCNRVTLPSTGSLAQNAPTASPPGSRHPIPSDEITRPRVPWAPLRLGPCQPLEGPDEVRYLQAEPGRYRGGIAFYYSERTRGAKWDLRMSCGKRIMARRGM